MENYNKFKINKDKIVFIDLTWMKDYKGYEPYSHGSGLYPKEKAPHEMFNFKEKEGFLYGYTTPYCKLNLNRVSDEIKEDEFGKFLDNVLVIFTSPPKDKKGRAIIGWYLDAKAYAEPLETKDIERYMHKINQFAPYNLICKLENGVLLDEEDRTYTIPHAKTGVAGFGQSQKYYAQGKDHNLIKENALKYIIHVLEDRRPTFYDDEKKYLEGSAKIQDVKVSVRSREAREACLKHYGCECRICGFDFSFKYGEIGKDFIEVHHIESITKNDGKAYEVDPINDLIPVCSNCHSMLHKNHPPHSPKYIETCINKACTSNNKEEN